MALGPEGESGLYFREFPLVTVHVELLLSEGTHLIVNLLHQYVIVSTARTLNSQHAHSWQGEE